MQSEPATDLGVECESCASSVDKFIDAPQKEPWLLTCADPGQLGEGGRAEDGEPLLAHRGQFHGGADGQLEEDPLLNVRVQRVPVPLYGLSHAVVAGGGGCHGHRGAEQ